MVRISRIGHIEIMSYSNPRSLVAQRVTRRHAKSRPGVILPEFFVEASISRLRNSPGNRERRQQTNTNNLQLIHRVSSRIGRVEWNSRIKKGSRKELTKSILPSPPRPNPRLRSRRANAAPTVIVVAIAVDVRRVVTVGEARVRGIVVPIAAAKASTLYCYPFFSEVFRSFVD